MERLDVILVCKGMCETRSQAKSIIQNGKVAVNGQIITKCGQKFDNEIDIKIEKDAIKYVSRGGFKLEKALEVFNINVKDEIVLDIGSSTGGFCDCALKFGAKQVIAVDVGVNQLHKTLKENKNVLSFEGKDIREFSIPSGIKPKILVGDLSFISLSKILPHISTFESVESFCLLVKPQFECGLEMAKKYKGIINDLSVHKCVLQNVWNDFENNNLVVLDLTTSPIFGGDGNIEYLIYAKSAKAKKEKLTEKEKTQKISNVLDQANQKMSRRE